MAEGCIERVYNGLDGNIAEVSKAILQGMEELPYQNELNGRGYLINDGGREIEVRLDIVPRRDDQTSAILEYEGDTDLTYEFDTRLRSRVDKLLQ